MRFMSMEPTSKSVWLRRACTLKLVKSSTSAMARQRAAFHLRQIAFAICSPEETRATPNLANELGAALFRLPIGALAHKHAQATRDTVDGDDVEIGEQRLRVFSRRISNVERLWPFSPISW